MWSAARSSRGASRSQSSVSPRLMGRHSHPAASRPAAGGPQRAPPPVPRGHRPAARAGAASTATVAVLDLYQVLGVEYGADATAIKAAYRARAKVLHPDVNPAPDAAVAFRRLKRAAEVLSCPELRAAHDSELLAAGAPAEAAAAARARDPRFARFERWRSEIWTDLNAQLDEWTAEVTQLLAAAEASLAAQERTFQAIMLHSAPTRGAWDSVDGLQHGGGGSDGGSGGGDAARRARLRQLVAGMQGVLADAPANVQRLYDKRFEQLQSRWAYPDLVWYDRWLTVGDSWLDAATQLELRWRPRVAGAAQWLPPDGR